MESIAFAFPVLPGRSAAVRKFCAEHQGHRLHEFHQTRGEHGLGRVRVYHQMKPVEMVVVYLEGEDLRRSFASHRASDHEFDLWFKRTMREIHGFDSDIHGDIPGEMIVEWSQE